MDEADPDAEADTLSELPFLAGRRNISSRYDLDTWFQPRERHADLDANDIKAKKQSVEHPFVEDLRAEVMQCAASMPVDEEEDRGNEHR